MLNHMPAAFADELRRVRVERGLTQKQVGEQLPDHGAPAVTEQAVGVWERGEAKPSRDKAQALERLLDVQPGAFTALLGYALDGERTEGIEEQVASLQGQVIDLTRTVEELRQLFLSIVEELQGPGRRR